VKNVHIRYEDKYSIKNKTISFGIYIKEFRAETVDANGKPNFLNADEKIIYKIGELNGLNMYWNCLSNSDSLIIAKKDFNKNDNWVVSLLVAYQNRHLNLQLFLVLLQNILRDSITTGVINSIKFETCKVFF
jgi:hypothetical protein